MSRSWATKPLHAIPRPGLTALLHLNEGLGECTPQTMNVSSAQRRGRPQPTVQSLERPRQAPFPVPNRGLSHIWRANRRTARRPRAAPRWSWATAKRHEFRDSRRRASVRDCSGCVRAPTKCRHVPATNVGEERLSPTVVDRLPRRHARTGREEVVVRTCVREGPVEQEREELLAHYASYR